MDVETTGLDETRDRIIDIGIVKLNRDGSQTTFSQLINPGFKISKEIRKLTGITLKSLSKAPSFEDIFPEIRDMLNVDLLLAHNSKFDFGFISEEYARLRKEILVPHLDTVKLAKIYYPNYLTYNLDSIVTRLKINVENRHRGLDDALVLLTLFNKIKNDFGEDDLNETMEKIVNIPKSKIQFTDLQPSLFI